MADSNIIEIIVRAVDKTHSGLTTPIKNVDDLAKSVTNLAPAFTAIATAAAAAFIGLTKHEITVADETRKLAQSAGLATESFSTMAYAANLSKINAEKLGNEFKFLNKAINEAHSGNEKQRDIFEQLGIVLTKANGQLKDAGEITLEVADRFRNSADGAGKAAVAIALFGRNGSEMIPFLNQGRAAIESLTYEAKALGMEISGGTGKSSEEFNDNLSRMNSAVRGLVRQFVAGVIPMLAEFTESIFRATKQSGIFVGIGLTLVDIFKGMAIAVRLVWLVLETLGRTIGVLASIFYDFLYGIVFNAISIFVSYAESIITVVKGLIALGETAGKVGEILYQFFSGDFKSAFETGKKTVGEMRDTIVNVGKQIAETWTENGKIAGETLLQSWNNIKAASKGLSKDVMADAKAFADFSVKLYEGLKVEAPEANKPQLNLIDTKELTKTALDAQKIVNAMLANMQSGSAKLNADETKRFQDRLAEIEKLNLTKQQKRELEILAEQEHQFKLSEIYKQALDFRAELDAAAKEGDIQRALNLMNSEAGIRAQDLAGRQEFISAYQQMFQIANRNIWSYAAGIMNQFYTSFSSHVANAITGTESWGDAFKAVGKEIIGAIVRMAAQWIASQIIVAIAGKSIMAASATASITSAASVAAAWAVAATGALIATFGGAGAAGALYAPLAAANAAFGSGLALAQTIGGAAHSGLDSVPFEGTYLLQKGERVVQPEGNQDLTEFLENQQSNNGMMELNIVLDGEILARAIGRLGRDGRLTIPARAIA